MNTIKRRLGFVTVVAVAAAATAIVTGNSLVATIIAIAVGLALVVVMGNRSGDSTDGTHPRNRSRGEPFSASYRWKGSGQLDLADLRRALEAEGLAVVSEDSDHREVVFKGGSQLRTRLRGGYFIDPRQLPIQVGLRSSLASATGEATVELNLRDRFGIAVRDEALADRFEQSIVNIRKVVEARLHTMGDFGVAAESPRKRG